MSKDSTWRVISVALIVCVVCSVLVSTASIQLKNRQQKNQQREKKLNILKIAGLYNPNDTVDKQFQKLTSLTVELHTGKILDKSPTKPSMLTIPVNADLAGIKQRPETVEIYLEKNGDSLKQIILPVYGKGLWSTMYGFIALANDCNTVSGLGFYEHGETPGLGGEIENPNWLKSWQGKKVYSPDAKLALSVVKPGNGNTSYTVDGLSGATLTSRGVSNMIYYWLGQDGYGHLLEQICKKGGFLQ